MVIYNDHQSQGVDMQGKWAVVTGASSGLGTEFARNLAKRGYNVVLVARSEAPMQLLAQDLRRLPIDVVVESLDLSAAGSAAELRRRLDRLAIEPDVLINNAGAGISGAFVTQDEDRIRA